MLAAAAADVPAAASARPSGQPPASGQPPVTAGAPAPRGGAPLAWKPAEVHSLEDEACAETEAEVAEARAVVADKATMAMLSEEVVAQLEASMGAAETNGAAGASAEEDWRKKEAEELKAKQAAEAKKAAEKAKAEEEAAAKAAALEAAGKKVAGGLHKFDASEVDVNGGSATADDFMDAFGF